VLVAKAAQHNAPISAEITATSAGDSILIAQHPSLPHGCVMLNLSGFLAVLESPDAETIRQARREQDDIAAVCRLAQAA
jgi:hypothetical protein